MLQRVMSRFSIENFLSHSAENFRWGALRCFRKFLVWKNYESEEGYHVFPSKIFCLTVPKNLVGEPFCAVLQKISGSEKVYG